MKRRYITEAWDDYRRKLLDPIQAGPTQIEETRRAFYAGANVMFQIWNGFMGLSEAEVMEQVEAIGDELEDYLRQFIRKHGI